MEKLRAKLKNSWWFRDLPPLEGYTRLFRTYVSNGMLLRIAVVILAIGALYTQVVQPLLASQLNEEIVEPDTDHVVEEPPSPEVEITPDSEPVPDEEPTPEVELEPEDDYQVPENATETSVDPRSLLDSMFNVTVNIYGDVEIVTEGAQ